MEMGLMLLNFLDCDPNLEPIVKFVKGIFKLIQFVIPIGLIIMGSIDLGKAVLSSDDKEIKQATSKLIKRAIAAVAIFFIVLLVELVMGLISDANTDAGKSEGNSESWISCWNGETADEE